MSTSESEKQSPSGIIRYNERLITIDPIELTFRLRSAYILGYSEKWDHVVVYEFDPSQHNPLTALQTLVVNGSPSGTSAFLDLLDTRFKKEKSRIFLYTFEQQGNEALIKSFAQEMKARKDHITFENLLTEGFFADADGAAMIVRIGGEFPVQIGTKEFLPQTVSEMTGLVPPPGWED